MLHEVGWLFQVFLLTPLVHWSTRRYIVHPSKSTSISSLLVRVQVNIIPLLSRRDLLPSDHTLSFIVDGGIYLSFVNVTGVEAVPELSRRYVLLLVMVYTVPWHYYFRQLILFNWRFVFKCSFVKWILPNSSVHLTSWPSLLLLLLLLLGSWRFLKAFFRVMLLSKLRTDIFLILLLALLLSMLNTDCIIMLLLLLLMESRWILFD